MVEKIPVALVHRNVAVLRIALHQEYNIHLKYHYQLTIQDGPLKVCVTTIYAYIHTLYIYIYLCIFVFCMNFNIQLLKVFPACMHV